MGLPASGDVAHLLHLHHRKMGLPASGDVARLPLGLEGPTHELRGLSQEQVSTRVLGLKTLAASTQGLEQRHASRSARSRLHSTGGDSAASDTVPDNA